MLLSNPLGIQMNTQKIHMAIIISLFLLMRMVMILQLFKELFFVKIKL